MTLEGYLDALAHSTKLIEGAGNVAALRSALAADADMAEQARSMIVKDAHLPKRDHITRWRNDILRRALEE